MVCGNENENMIEMEVNNNIMYRNKIKILIRVKFNNEIFIPISILKKNVETHYERKLS